MTSTDRLSAAQTARAAAKRAFNTAVSAATAAAIARGLRSVEAIDAAVEADERVIAARAASAKAAEELTAAEAAVRADASVSQEDRMHAMTQGAHAMARTHVEHDPATIYDPAAGTEAQSVTSTAPSAPLSHSETIAAAAVPAAYCEPGEDVSTCARRAFGAGVVVDTMMRGAQGRTLVGAVATRRTGPHFAVYAAVTPAPRYVIVNARGRLADDLGDMGRGADFGWPTEADAEAALENLAETTGWDVDSYSVRAATAAEIAANT